MPVENLRGRGSFNILAPLYKNPGVPTTAIIFEMYFFLLFDNGHVSFSWGGKIFTEIYLFYRMQDLSIFDGMRDTLYRKVYVCFTWQIMSHIRTWIVYSLINVVV